MRDLFVVVVAMPVVHATISQAIAFHLLRARNVRTKPAAQSQYPLDTSAENTRLRISLQTPVSQFSTSRPYPSEFPCVIADHFEEPVSADTSPGALRPEFWLQT